jgi:hypothetical protein
MLVCCVVAVCCNEGAVFSVPSRSVLRDASGVVESRRSHLCSSQKGRYAARQESGRLAFCVVAVCCDEGAVFSVPFSAWSILRDASGVVESRRSHHRASQKGR